MNILILGTAKMAPSLRELGHQVVIVSYDRIELESLKVRLWAEIANHKFDFILIVQGKRLSPEISRILKRVAPIWLWFVDDITEWDRNRFDLECHALRASFISASGLYTADQISLRIKKRVFHIMEGADPGVCYPGTFRPDFSCDLSFIGSRVSTRTPGDSRTELYRKALKVSNNVKFFGRGWKTKEVFHDDFRDVVASSRINLGINHLNDMPFTWSARVWKTMLCGGFLFHRYIPGIDETFTNWKHLVVWKDWREFGHFARMLLNDTKSREKIAQEGRRFVLEHYTYKHSMLKLLSILGG